jgi:hypothetical protein
MDQNDNNKLVGQTQKRKLPNKIQKLLEKFATSINCRFTNKKKFYRLTNRTDVETIFLFRLPTAESRLLVDDGLVAVNKWSVGGKRLIYPPLIIVVFHCF